VEQVSLAGQESPFDLEAPMCIEVSERGTKLLSSLLLKVILRGGGEEGVVSLGGGRFAHLRVPLYANTCCVWPTWAVPNYVRTGAA
jgi:hypothetical protein